MSHRSRAGLTLLELMIVLIILVMLIAIAGPRLFTTQEKADVKLATIQIGNFESALKLYHLDMKSYPTTEEGLEALVKAPTDEAKARRWGPDAYYDDEVIPVDPWSNAYIYEYLGAVDGGRDAPRIRSAGPDGQANTDDDIINWRESGSGSTATSSSGSGSGIDGLN